jgi:hypothetical protein
MADLLEKDGDEKRSRLRKYADIETIMSRCQNIHHHHSVNRFYEHQEGMKIVYDLLTSIDPLINFDEWKRNPSNGKNLVFKLLSSFGQLMKGPHCGNTVVRDFLEQLDPVFRYLATTETAWIDTQKVTYEVIKIIMDFMLKNTGMGGIKRQHWADESLLPGLCCAESHFDGTPDKADDEEVI